MKKIKETGFFKWALLTVPFSRLSVYLCLILIILFIIFCKFINSWSLYTFYCYFVGYLYFLIIGCSIVKQIINEIKSEVKFSTFTQTEVLAYAWYAKRIGEIDGILYISAFLTNHTEFIAVWLAFKLAGRWSSAEMEAPLEQERIRKFSTNKQMILHNAIYNIFTIGNALILLFAFASWKIIEYLKSYSDINFFKVLIIALGLPILSFLLYIFALKQSERLGKIS